MGLINKFGAAVCLAPVLGRRHGPDPGSGTPDRVAEAYRRAEKAAGAPEILKCDDEAS